MTRTFGLLAIFLLLGAACGDDADATDDAGPGAGTDGGPTGMDGAPGSCDCEVGELCCDVASERVCVDPSSDPSHCGSCGNVCTGTCNAGSCMEPDAGNPCAACASFELCCGDACVPSSVPIDTDGRDDASFDHCGGCGEACDEVTANGCSALSGSDVPLCVCGDSPACEEGQGCIADADTFTCTDLSTDIENCGAIGNACDETETCEAGVCTCATDAVCADGETCCEDACVATETDTQNCGGCGIVCNFGETCEAGECRCGGSAGCAPASSTDLGELCCDGSCVARSDDGCEECGVACKSMSSCVYQDDIGEACCGFEVLIGVSCPPTA